MLHSGTMGVLTTGVVPPSLFLILKLPDGTLAEVGLIHAVPSDGQGVIFEGQSYTVRDVSWAIGSVPNRGKAQVTVELKK